jgi:hypothetical protein
MSRDSEAPGRRTTCLEPPFRAVVKLHMKFSGSAPWESCMPSCASERASSLDGMTGGPTLTLSGRKVRHYHLR